MYFPIKLNRAIRNGIFEYRVSRLWPLIGLLLCLSARVVAGPPLVTDDPGILDPGTWEVIVAISGEDRPVGNVTQAPVLDVSLGVSKNSQISFLLPRLIIDQESDAGGSGLGHASVGYKWRGISTSTWELAIASNYTLPVTSESITPDGTDDSRTLGLPVLVSYFARDWTFNAQLGWNVDSDGARSWDYGLAASHPVGDSTQWMVEVFGDADSTFGNRTVNYQLGIDYEFGRNVHLLASMGSRFNSGHEQEGRLNYSFYVGLQWFRL